MCQFFDTEKFVKALKQIRRIFGKIFRNYFLNMQSKELVFSKHHDISQNISEKESFVFLRTS